MKHRHAFIFTCGLGILLNACDKPAAPSGNHDAANAIVAAMPANGTAGANGAYDATPQEGILFAKPGYPRFIKEVKGVSEPEPKGRWTDGSEAVFVFKEALHGKVHVEISGIPYGSNMGKKVALTLGNAKQDVVFNGDINTFETVSADFDLDTPSDTLVMRIPEPSVPPGGNRRLGIFLGTLKIK
ncbi:MAG TPA: hypothetical protein VIF60_06335 [Burkholderiaceae bacterium]